MIAATWAHGDPSVVIRGVLRDPAYRTAPATSHAEHASLVQIVLEWIYKHVLQPLFGPLAHAASASQGVGTVLGYVLIAVAFAFLAFVAYRLAIAFAAPSASRGFGSSASARALAAERDPRAWHELARLAAARGDYGSAIAALFGAALAVLDETSIVAFDAARTPGEYRRLVRRARAPASAPFDDLADRFVRALYAPARAERADYEAAREAFAAFEPALAA